MGSDGETDLLGRGWSPSRRVSATVLVVVGVLLMLHPLVGGLPDAAGLTGDVEYSAAEISPEGGDIEFRWLADVDRSVISLLYEHGGLALVDCLPEGGDRTDCALESDLTDSTATVDLSPSLWSGYTYHGRFYERVVADRGENVTVGLRPVEAETVLSNVSIPGRDWPDRVRRAVDDGRMTAASRLSSTGAVLSRDGRYYVVVPTSPVPDDERTGPLYTAFFTIVGLSLAHSGWKRYERQSVRKE
jgi:hypothetical protein